MIEKEGERERERKRERERERERIDLEGNVNIHTPPPAHPHTHTHTHIHHTASHTQARTLRAMNMLITRIETIIASLVYKALFYPSCLPGVLRSMKTEVKHVKRLINLS